MVRIFVIIGSALLPTCLGVIIPFMALEKKNAFSADD